MDEPPEAELEAEGEAEGEAGAAPGAKWRNPKWIAAGVGAIALAGAGVWYFGGSAMPGVFGVGSSSATVADLSLLPISFSGKCGYVDATGKMAINPQFDAATPFDSNSGLAAVRVGEKWGLIDREGAYVVNPQFDELHLDRDSGNISVVIGGKSGTLDHEGKIAINPQFDGIYAFDNSGRAVVRVGEKRGIIDSAGQFLISPEYDDILVDSSWRRENPGKALDFFAKPVLVQRDGKYGYVDGTGKVLIAPQFVQAGWFDASGYAAAAIEENDTDGLQRIRSENANSTEQMIRSEIGRYILGDIRSSGGNLSFDLINPNLADGAERWLREHVRGDWGISSDVSRDEYGIASRATLSLEQYAEVPKRQRYGFIDETGKFVVPPQFDSAGSFTDSGLAPVYVGGSAGYVDTKGKMQINPIYNYVGPFLRVNSEWLAVVGVSGERTSDEEPELRFGLIDTAGKYRINPQYDNLSDFGRDGLAVARSGDLLGAVDATGRYVLQPVYAELYPVRGTSKFVFVKSVAGSDDVREIGVIESDGTVVTTTRGGTCGLYLFS